MCFPPAIIAAVSVATSVASAAVGMAGAQQQYQQDKQRYLQNYSDALADARSSYGRLQSQEMENDQQYVEKDQLALIEGAQRQAQVAASAATANVAGPTVQEIVNGIGGAINMKRSTLNLQWRANVQQSEGEKQAATAQEADRIGMVAPPVAPNPLGFALQAIGSGLKFAGSSSGQGFFGGGIGGTGGGAGPDFEGLDEGMSALGGM